MEINLLILPGYKVVYDLIFMLFEHLQGRPKLVQPAPYHLTIPLVKVSGNRGSVLPGDVLNLIPLPKFLGHVVGRFVPCVFFYLSFTKGS